VTCDLNIVIELWGSMCGLFLSTKCLCYVMSNAGGRWRDCDEGTRREGMIVEDNVGLMFDTH